jgi:hypothetical protein
MTTSIKREKLHPKFLATDLNMLKKAYGYSILLQLAHKQVHEPGI